MNKRANRVEVHCQTSGQVSGEAFYTLSPSVVGSFRQMMTTMMVASILLPPLSLSVFNYLFAIAAFSTSLLESSSPSIVVVDVVGRYHIVGRTGGGSR